MENNSTFKIGDYVCLKIEVKNKAEKIYQIIEYDQTDDEYIVQLDAKTTARYKAFMLELAK